MIVMAVLASTGMAEVEVAFLADFLEALKFTGSIRTEFPVNIAALSPKQRQTAFQKVTEVSDVITASCGCLERVFFSMT